MKNLLKFAPLVLAVGFFALPALASATPTDDTLSSLTVDQGTLSPGFSSDTTSYTESVPASVTSITVTATANDANAHVSTDNSVTSPASASPTFSIVYGPQQMTIDVCAQDGVICQSYVISVTRGSTNTGSGGSGAHANVLSNLTDGTGTMSPTFDSSVTSYTDSVPASVTSLNITPSWSDTSDVVTVADNGAATTTATPSGSSVPVTLAYGLNTITVVVTPPDAAYAATTTLYAVWTPTVYVDATNGNDSNVGSQAAPFATIQAAVNAVASGDTIDVAAGTYNEDVTIGKSITLEGAGQGQTIISGSGSDDFIVKVDGVSGGAKIENLTVDGGGAAPNDNSLDYGIWVNNSGTNGTPVELDNLTVKDVWNTSANGIEIDASSVGGSYALIHDDTISSFDKRGVRFIDSSGKFYDSEIIGDNVDGTSRVQNLVNLWGGSNVEIYGNKLHNALTVGGTPTWDSPGIFVAAFGGDGASTANIHDNQIYSDDTGITLGSYYTGMAGVDPVANMGDGSTATITNNTFHDVNWAINLERSDVTATVHNNSFGTNVNAGVNSDDGNGGPASPASVDATDNYWGAASGPTDGTTNPSGTGATIYDAVSFSPWWTDAAMTTLGSTITPNGSGDQTTTTGSSDTTISGGSGSIVSTVTIPAGTTVTGDPTWDGTISPPTAVVETVTVPGFTTTVSSAIAIGSSNSDLTFSEPVQLTFAGEAGQLVGWYNAAGTFTQITAPCAGNDQAIEDSDPALAADGSSCYVSNDGSGNLVVWTKHFSTFVTYNQTANPTAPVSSGGGGGGGIVGSGPLSVGYQTGGVVLGTSTEASGAAGQVLGTSTSAYVFTTNVGYGTRDEEVMQLHAILIADGYLHIKAPTGWFGPLTLAAVKEYQKANGIVQTGFVGVLTRGALNAGV